MSTVLHRARWGTALKLTSLIASAICIGASATALKGISPAHSFPYLGYLPLLIVLGTVPFVIRGYRIAGESLEIDRLFWTTRIPLSGLISISSEPRAMKGSLRTCGNGGLYSFTGWYWSRRLGHYRAFVTDLDTTVVLRFPDRTLVLSPEDPEAFMSEFRGCLQSR